MAAQPVEWVLMIYYGPSAPVQRMGDWTGPTPSTRRTTFSFPKRLSSLIPFPASSPWPPVVPGRFPLRISGRRARRRARLCSSPQTVRTSNGRLISASPKAWKMSLAPSEITAETVPGDPSHLDFASAENELALLAGRGAGQPYLMAVKLRDEPNKLHLRAYLESPSEDFAWADLGRLVPQECSKLLLRRHLSNQRLHR